MPNPIGNQGQSKARNKVSDAYSASRTISCRLSPSDIAALDDRAIRVGQTRSTYASSVLTDHVRPQVGERSLVALSALLRCASLASRSSHDPELVRRLHRICQDALERIAEDLA